MRSYLAEEIPIFIARLVEDWVWIMTGGAAQVGRVGKTAAMRSATNCLAKMESVSGLKMSTISDKSETDLERITSSPGTPLSACSRGTVTSSSTSAAESPRDKVWISTLGGANSGNTSIDELLSRARPKTINAMAAKITRYRYCKLVLTIQRILVSSRCRDQVAPAGALLYRYRASLFNH